MEPCGLPGDANLEHLRKQAKELQRRSRAGDPRALEWVASFHPRTPEPATLTRSDAQLVVARRYGFESWPRLVRHLDVAERYRGAPHQAPPATGDDEDALAWDFLRLACLNYGEDDRARRDQARELLCAHSALPARSIHIAAAVGDLRAAAALVAADPATARRPGGPHGWEPLLYLTYGRRPAVEVKVPAAYEGQLLAGLSDALQHLPVTTPCS